jgi:thioredoxin-dependent peroxiredoxin
METQQKNRPVTKAILLGVALMWNNVFGQKIDAGHTAPSFKVTDANGQCIDLESYRGRKVMLSFFRYVSCPVCNFRVHELIVNHNAISAKGYTIVAVFESDNPALKEYLAETPLPFAVIGNADLTLYRKYGVQKSVWRMMFSVFNANTLNAAMQGRKYIANSSIKRDGALTRLPADFLIDENGVVTKAYYGKNIGDHLPISFIVD